MNPLYSNWVLGQDSWKFVARMLLVADRVTIWGPSHNQIFDANKNHGFPYTPQQFLTLIKEGFVRVAARESWLSSPSGRPELAAKSYIWTEWVPSFDEVIRDQITSGRACALPTTDVEEWIEGEISGAGECYLNAKSAIENNSCPEAFTDSERRRLNESFDDHVKRVKGTLRFARNHYLATEMLECSYGIENADYPKFFSKIGSYPNKIPVISPSKDKLSILDTIYYMSKVNYNGLDDAGNFKRHIDALHMLKDYGLKADIQHKSLEYFDLEDDVLGSLARKIRKFEASWSEIDEIAVSGATVALALKDLHDNATSINRRNLLSLGTAFGFTAASGITAADAAAGATDLIEPVVELNSTERALAIVMKNSDIGNSVPLSLLKELHNEVNRIKLPS